MTFNLRRHTRRDGPNAWPARREAVADAIRAQAPDLLATQEGTLSQLADLDERLPGYLRVGGDREHWPGEEPNALYYDPDRVRVLDAGTFWLSRTPLAVGSRTWGDWGRRNALWALVLFVETGASALVLNTHFDHVSILARRRSAQLIQDVAPRSFVLGDFNARPGRLVHSVLLQGRIDPLWGARHTYNEFRRRNRGRIDWILVPEGTKVRRSAILQPRRADGGPVSDHLPVVVDVEAPEAEERIEAPDHLWDHEVPVETRLPPAPDKLVEHARACVSLLRRGRLPPARA